MLFQDNIKILHCTFHSTGTFCARGGHTNQISGSAPSVTYASLV